MLALIKHPGSPTRRIELTEIPQYQLSAMQTLIGSGDDESLPKRCYIEIAAKGRDFVVWCDEEGKLREPPLAVNFIRPQDGDPIVGTVLVTGLQRGLDGMEPAPLSAVVAFRVARLLDQWAARGELCGFSVDDFDPRDDADRAHIMTHHLRRIP